MRVRLQQARPRSDPGHIISAAGSRPSTRVLDHASYQDALRAKLLEEAQEAEVAADEQLASELADVLEVLRALATAHGMRWEDIELQARRKRRAERCGFQIAGLLRARNVDQVSEIDAGEAPFTCLDPGVLAADGRVGHRADTDPAGAEGKPETRLVTCFAARTLAACCLQVYESW